MIILNDNRFSDEVFFEVKTLDDIKNSPNNSTLIFNYSDKLLETFKFCRDNSLNYGVKIKSIKEFVFVSSLNSKYVFVDNLKLARKIQNIANEYLSDTKVVIVIRSDNKIDKIAKNSIDGVFFDIIRKKHKRSIF